MRCRIFFSPDRARYVLIAESVLQHMYRYAQRSRHQTEAGGELFSPSPYSAGLLVDAIAGLARETPSDVVARAYGGEARPFGPRSLIPSPFDPRLILRIAPAVAMAAMDSGVATRPITSFDDYYAQLERFAFRSGLVMKPVFAKAKGQPVRVIYAEGEDERVLRAVQVALDEGLYRPTLIGRPAVLQSRIQRAGLREVPAEGDGTVGKCGHRRHPRGASWVADAAAHRYPATRRCGLDHLDRIAVPADASSDQRTVECIHDHARRKIGEESRVADDAPRLCRGVPRRDQPVGEPTRRIRRSVGSECGADDIGRQPAAERQPQALGKHLGQRRRLAQAEHIGIGGLAAEHLRQLRRRLLAAHGQVGRFAAIEAREVGDEAADGVEVCVIVFFCGCDLEVGAKRFANTFK